MGLGLNIYSHSFIAHKSGLYIRLKQPGVANVSISQNILTVDADR